MDFDSWTNRAVDNERRRRLAYGYVIGLLTMGSLGTAMALSTNEPAAVEEAEEDVMAVQLAEEPEPEPEPEPAVEPEPEPAEPPPPQEMTPPPGPVLPTLEVPTDVPDDAPEEADPSKEAFNPYASGDPYKYATQGTVRRAPVVAKVVKAATPVAKPSAPAGPSRVTADTTPPQQLSAPAPAYPASAKAAGIQGRVVVSFVVDTQGAVTDVRAVQGPEALRAACEESVRQRRYSPAMRGGLPVSVKKNTVCNYKLN